MISAGHTEGDWIVDQEATETAPGMQHKECTKCGQFIKSELIPATGSGSSNQDETSTESQKNVKGGCGASIGVGVGGLMALAGLAFVLVKRKES